MKLAQRSSHLFARDSVEEHFVFGVGPQCICNLSNIIIAVERSIFWSWRRCVHSKQNSRSHSKHDRSFRIFSRKSIGKDTVSTRRCVVSSVWADLPYRRDDPATWSWMPRWLTWCSELSSSTRVSSTTTSPPTVCAMTVERLLLLLAKATVWDVSGLSWHTSALEVFQKL